MTILNKLKQLQTVQNEIELTCRLYNVDSKDIDNISDVFSDADLDNMLKLLKYKLRLQMEVYKEQGGDLSNVIFLSSRR